MNGGGTTHLDYNQEISVQFESSGLPGGRRESAAFDDVYVGCSKDCGRTSGRHGGRRTRIGRETLKTDKSARVK